jgi:hypothetical protein
MLSRFSRLVRPALVVLAMAVVVAVPVAAFAQAAAAPEAAVPSIDWTKMAVDAIAGLTSVLVFLGVWAFKAAWTKIPASVVLFATPIAGVVFNYALNYLTGHTLPNPILAALAGVAAISLREILTTLVTKGVSGVVTPTKLSF